MAAYREDSCDESQINAPGFYAERSNQDDRDRYLGTAAEFDFNTTYGSEDFTPGPDDDKAVSLGELTKPAPYVFTSAAV